jgi:CHAT domain-containing protein
VQKAPDDLNQALPIEQDTNNRAAQAMTQNTMGRVYAEQGEKNKAFELFRSEALGLAQLALLRRSSAPSGVRSQRGFEAVPEPTSAPLNAAYSHPFYGAPFMLIGNFQ